MFEISFEILLEEGNSRRNLSMSIT